VDNGRKWKTNGDKTLGKPTNHPTQAHIKGDNGKQGEIRRREGGHTIQETSREMGNKGKQDLAKVDTPSKTGRQEETRPREGGHTKAEAPSKTDTHVGR
jgi:hypothetical protein